MVLYSPNDPLFLIGFKHFFHYVAHLVGFAPFISRWFVTLHLWATFGPHGDSPFSLHPWLGEDEFP
jgi:hypothetical protein